MLRALHSWRPLNFPEFGVLVGHFVVIFNFWADPNRSSPPGFVFAMVSVCARSFYKGSLFPSLVGGGYPKSQSPELSVHERVFW